MPPLETQQQQRNCNTRIFAHPSGNKYVPPHLRKSQGSTGGGGGGNYNNNNSGGGGGGGGPPRSYESRGGGGGGYDRDRRNFDSRSGGGGGSRSSFSDSRSANSGGGGSAGGGGGNYDGPRRSSYHNSYNNNNNSSSAFQEDGGGSAPLDGPPATNSRWGGGPGGGGGAGRGSFAGRRDSMARTNERGFHGDMKPDKRLEARLFDNSDKQHTGINFDNYDKIPCEVSGDNLPDPIEVYEVETIGEDLFRNSQLCGYTRPTPVQKYSVPIGNMGRDLMACAQTGSGKTAGFLFPIIMAMIKMGGREPPETSRRRTYPEALILAPTRELAQQIYEEARRFTYCTGIAPVCIYGGADVREQLRQIERGCDLLVATPGRLVDLIERGRLGMENVHFLTLDEADRMLDMGFEVRVECRLF